MAGAHKRPKRFWLQGLVEKHEAELIYDLRKLGINPAEVDVDELILLVDVLIRDPESWTHAALASWKHPVSYEWTVLVATYDMLAQVNSRRKPKPYPRPWPDPNVRSKGKPQKNAREILKRARDGDLEWQKPLSPM
jgi:hypothetical protein